MHIVIHTDATTAKSERHARHLADAIWALQLATGASCVIVEMADGRRWRVIGDALPTPPPKKKQTDNPCDRCGFNVTQADRHGDPMPQHTTERDCFRAVYEAALEKAREEIGASVDKHVGAYHASEA